MYLVPRSLEIVPHEIGDVPAVLDDEHERHGRIVMDRADLPC
jgi:hypothetical protein